MPVRWKVVTKDRKSCLVTDEKYCYSYKKGSIVKARKETVGVMTFTTEKAADNFMYEHFTVEQSIVREIIKVNGLGKGRRPKRGELCNYTDVTTFYKGNLSIASLGVDFNAPKGTMCYKKVKVLT